MPKKQKKFADDGWAVWVDGDDTSTVYINNWLNILQLQNNGFVNYVQNLITKCTFIISFG